VKKNTKLFVLLVFFMNYTQNNRIYSAHIPGIVFLSDETDNQNVMDTVIEVVYTNAQEQFNIVVKSFVDKLTYEIQNLGYFDELAKIELESFVDRELNDAILAINNISITVMNDYYYQMNLLGNGLSINVSDSVAKQIKYTVNALENDIAGELKAVAALLVAEDRLPDISAIILEGLNAYQQTAREEYDKMQRKAPRHKDVVWWEDIKVSGENFLSEFKINVKKEGSAILKKALDKEIKKSKKKS